MEPFRRPLPQLERSSALVSTTGSSARYSRLLPPSSCLLSVPSRHPMRTPTGMSTNPCISFGHPEPQQRSITKRITICHGIYLNSGEPDGRIRAFQTRRRELSIISRQTRGNDPPSSGAAMESEYLQLGRCARSRSREGGMHMQGSRIGMRRA